MSASPRLGIPELAGLCTYQEAARVGIPVEENVRRLLHYHWVEMRLFEVGTAHLPSTPEWEVKCALALHQWLDVEHAGALRDRVAEMRNPVPRLDSAPDAALDAFLEELLRAADTVELLTGVYRVARPALLDAYRRHADETNPLVDHPTRRLLRHAIADEEDAVAWGETALRARVENDPAAGERAAAWEAHLRTFLEAAGGVAGTATPSGGELPPPRASTPFRPDTTPRRDARFRGSYNFNFPPHVVYSLPEIPPEERNLALVCKRTLEMDVPEMMASFLAERPGESWEFYADYSRQLWDEARHAMMGSVWMEAQGVDWMTHLPLNVGFSLRLNRHAEPLERQAILYSIEQGLMPGRTGKRFEYETAMAAGDPLSAHFHDYDWADEVLHAHIGRRRMRADGLSSHEAIELAARAQERTWNALDGYRALYPQPEWWRRFVHLALGRESRAPDDVVHAQPLTS